MDSTLSVFRLKRKGISTYIAVLLLIILAIAAGLLIWAYFMGYLGAGTPTVVPGKAMVIDSLAQQGGELLVYVKNVGAGTLRLSMNSGASVYVEESRIENYVLGGDASEGLLEETKTGLIRIVIRSVWAGKTVRIKVVASDGTYAEGSYKIATPSGIIIQATAGPGGSISPSGSVVVNYGANQVFTITPNTGYHVSDVLVDGGSVGAVTSYTFTSVTASHTIAASFAINTYTITVTQSTHGTIAPGTTVVNYDGSQVFTITPDQNYYIVEVFVDSVSQGVRASYTFTNVIADHTISATFAAGQAPVTHTITASAGAGGSINPSGALIVNHGANQAFAIAANQGYYIVDVVVDSVSQGVRTSYTFTNVIGDHTISASFAHGEAPVTHTITASAGAGGSINPSGALIVNHGANQAFAITPSTGYHVSDVLVDGGSVGAVTSYTFTSVTSTHTIAATFAINTYTITVTQGANGVIAPGTTTVNYGASQAFAITPNTGYHIVEVFVDSVSQGVRTSYTFTNVIADHMISASFASNAGVTMYTITVTAGSGGSITPGTVTVYKGVTQVFTITPNVGYHIASVLVDGASQGVVSSYTFTNVQADHEVSATFAINTYTITVTQGANGVIAPGTTTVNYGASQAFAITPNTGYHVVDVLVDSVSKGAITSYTFTNVQAVHTITASFAIDTFTITPSVSGSHGTISPSTVQTVNYGATPMFTFTPETGYHVNEVRVDGSLVTPSGNTYTFPAVTASHTISVSFAIDTYTITVTQGANGVIAPGTTTVNYGASQAFTITANTGYKIFEVIVDGVSKGTINSYTFSNVQANHVITASFVTQNSVIENFNGEGDSWDDNWDYWDNPPWRRATDQYRSDPASATSDWQDDGYFSSDPINTQGANAIHISFWYMVRNTNSQNDLTLYYSGRSDASSGSLNNWNQVPAPNSAIGTPAYDMTWYYISFTIARTSSIPGDFVDASAFSSTFRFRFNSVLISLPGGTTEQVWVDDVCIELIP